MFLLVYYPPGSLPTNVDKTSYPQSPLDTTEGTPPPIPPQQFSVDDILLLPKLSESYKLQQNGIDAPPPLPLKTIQEDVTASTLTPKTYNENTPVLPLPNKTNKKAASLPAPPTVNQKDTTLLPCPPKANEDGTTIPSHTPNEIHEGTALAQHLTEQTTVRSLSKFVKEAGYPQIQNLLTIRK